MKGLEEIFVWVFEALVRGAQTLKQVVKKKIKEIIQRKKVRKNFSSVDYNERKQKRKRNYTRNPYLDEQILLKIKEKDSHFDEVAFKEWVREVFISYQKAWSTKNMMGIRGMLEENFMEQSQLRLQTYQDENSFNVVEVLKVNYVDFFAYNEDREKEIVEMILNTSFYEYNQENTTGKVVGGSNQIKQRTTYQLLFLRKKGTKTETTKKVERCPNCGAKLEMIQNKCEYCETWVLNGVRNWLLTDVERY